MVTHLVIADVPTLNRLLWAASGRLMVVDDPAVLLGGRLPWVHRETGDTWLFRAPETFWEHPPADFVYADLPADGIVASDALDHHPDSDRQSRLLPLIAACDLLGVDEL